MLGLFTLFTTGCVTESIVSKGIPTGPDPTIGERIPGVVAADPAAGGPASATNAVGTNARGARRMLTEIQPLGRVPYDNMTLPLVSPDGRFIVTQTGLAPTWRSVLAQSGAAVPNTTRLEIYDIGDAPRQPPVLVTVVDESVLLGRTANERGFLVEAPRGNGARWIGLASWRDGTIEWLVHDDDTVAAFASLGPDGQLAWSARSVQGERFDLYVEHSGERWTLEGQTGDWLMPTWGNAENGDERDGLFVLYMENDALDLHFASATTPSDFRRTIQGVPIATDNATLETAYQTVVAQPTTILPSGRPYDEVYFFHPTRLRTALWRPPTPPMILDATSLAAVTDPDDDTYTVTTLPDRVVRAHLTDDRARNRLLTSMGVPRRTAAPTRPIVVLNPRDHEIEMTVILLRR